MNYDLPPPPPSAAISNIADLSYRNYDGPLVSRVARWWIISKSGIQGTLKKPGFWVAVAFCLIPYLAHGFAFYLQEQLASMGGPGAMLMGAGGVTAMGCTIGQGVSGLSTLAVGSFLALAAMIVGCGATLKYQYWKMMKEG